MKPFRMLASIALVILTGSAPFAAAETICELAAPARGRSLLCRTMSEQGKALTLVFASERVTRQTEAARLCSEPSASIDEAVLWMPAHEHGSGPTSLARAPDGCTEIADVDFMMLGLWEVQVHFPDDGDRAVFEVQIER